MSLQEKILSLNKILFIFYLISIIFLSDIKFFSVSLQVIFCLLMISLNQFSVKNNLLVFFKSVNNNLFFLYIFSFLNLFIIFYLSDNLNPGIKSITKHFIFPLLILYFAFILSITYKSSNFIRSIFLIIFINVILAIFQFFGVDFFWDFKRLYFPIHFDYRYESNVLFRDKIMGFSSNPINFSYFLIFFVASLSHYSRNLFTSDKISSLFIFIFLLFLLIITQSRSLILSYAFSIIFTLFYTYKLKISFNKYLMFIPVIMISLLFFNKNGFTDLTAYSRLIHLYAGFNVFLDNLLHGIGFDSYTKYSYFYLDMLQDHFSISDYLYYESSHNSYLNVLIKYGIFGFLSIFSFFIFLYKTFNLSKNHNLSFLYMCYVITYLFNSFFHNQGFFAGDQFFLMCVSVFAFYFSNKHERLD